MSPSQSCIDLICELEGFKSHKYNDEANHCTIGYGTLLHKGPCNGSEGYDEGISQTEARELLLSRLLPFAEHISEAVKVPLTQNQFDALCSFVYNIGVEAFLESTLLRKLNAGLIEEVPAQMRRWDHDGGKVSHGLDVRREKEIALFLHQA